MADVIVTFKTESLNKSISCLIQLWFSFMVYCLTQSFVMTTRLKLRDVE